MPDWNLFDYTMKESRRLDTIATLGIHTNMRTLSKWFRTNYLSKVFDDRIPEKSERLHALDTIAASTHFNKDFQTVLSKWVIDKYSNWLSWMHDKATLWHYDEFHWSARQFCMLIHSKNLALELQFMNFALASLRLAWNISGMKESELLNHELLDVLSEVVLKLSGRDTWDSTTLFNIPFKECSKFYFIKV